MRAVVSNDIPGFPADDFSETTAAIRSVDLWALVDTGATHSAIDEEVRLRLALRQQSVKQVLYPNMTDAEFRPAFAASLELCEHPSDGSKIHAWGDALELLAFDLSGRRFQLVLGMDVLGRGKLTVTGTGLVSFDY